MQRLRERYEKPTLIRHRLGALNPMARPQQTLPGGRIDGFRVEDLVARHGSPLFVVSEGELRRRYRALQRAFSLRYPRVTVGYSFKTNYLSAVCAVLLSEGAWAEVVSGFEYEIAEALGVPGDHIIFNGPLKRRPELERAVAARAIINVDSLEEIAAIESIAADRGVPVSIGMRVNMQVTDTPWDRFGFNLENGQALEAAGRLASSPHLRLGGLHTHLGTYITDVDAYGRGARKLADFCRALNQPLDYLDCGGGFASRNRLHGQFLPVEHVVPGIDRYAEALSSALLGAGFAADRMPRLIVEPGRTLVDEAVHLITSVVSCKKLADGRRAYVIDAGVNVLPSSYWYRYDIVAVKDEVDVSEEVTLFGPLCMNIDVVQQGVALPPLRAEDRLVVRNVGAYNFAQSMQFGHLRPAVVMVGDGGVEVIREAESTAWARMLERVPKRLEAR